DPKFYPDIAYAFQAAVIDTLVIKTVRALKHTQLKTLVVAGGVGANLVLRDRLSDIASSLKIALFFPRIAYCTDNGAMVAYTGCQRLLAGESDESLEIRVRPRWSLEELLPIRRLP